MQPATNGGEEGRGKRGGGSLQHGLPVLAEDGGYVVRLCQHGGSERHYTADKYGERHCDPPTPPTPPTHAQSLRWNLSIFSGKMGPRHCAISPSKMRVAVTHGSLTAWTRALQESVLASSSCSVKRPSTSGIAKRKIPERSSTTTGHKHALSCRRWACDM